jgi:hypothetical protein
VNRRGNRVTIGTLAVLAALASSLVLASAASAASYNVLNFGARGNGVTNDTAAFQRAVDTASAHGSLRYPGIVYVPARSYVVANLRMKSNVWMRAYGGAHLILPHSAGTNSAVMSMGAPRGFIWNVRLAGIQNGPTRMVTLDVSHAGSRYVNAIQVRNVKNFAIGSVHIVQNASNPRGAPSTYGGGITFHSVPGSRGGGPYYDPQHGWVSNVVSTGSPYAFGPVVVGSAAYVRFSKIVSWGGVALKIETDQHIPGRVASVYGSYIGCHNGHSAVLLTPHGQSNSNIHISHVGAYSCESGIRLGQSTGGRFTRSSISSATIAGGIHAQVRDPRGGLTGGWWRIGRSQYCVSRDHTVGWYVAFSAIHCSNT